MTTLKELQKTIAAYNDNGQSKSSKKFMVDVYCDRVIVIGSDYATYLQSFLESKGASCHYDRGGWCISSADANKIGLNLESGTHNYQYADLRKKP
jgi:hypothetical protein